MELTPMVKGISLVTILIYLLQNIFNLSIFALYSNPELFRSYQMITHMFLHQNISHIISNLLLFIIVAPVVETYLDSGLKFLKLYLYSGMIGGLVQIITYIGLNTSSIGASGAVYGVLGACLFMAPSHSIDIFKIKIPILLIGALLIIPEIISCIAFVNDGVGHFCHMAGLITGIIYYFFNKK